MGWVGWVGDSALSYRIAYFGWGDKRGRGLGGVIIILWGVDEGWGGMGWAAWPGARDAWGRN